jgi:hypothetical protein
MNPLKLPFDQYQRYRVVTDAVEAVRHGREALRILDVGGSPGLARHFLPGDNILVLDRVPANGGPFVYGDGAALPFGGAAFDITISVDVLEHIAPGARTAFIDEMKRVSCGHVFIAAPFRTPAVEEAERILFDVIKAAKGEEHAFLREHMEHGLPDEEAIAKRLASGGWETVAIPNGALRRWLPMMALSIYMAGEPHLAGLTGRLNVFYNSNYYDSDNCSPSYRRLVGAARDGFSAGTKAAIEGLASKKEEGAAKELDLSWLSLFITLSGYRDLKKARDNERAEFRKVIEARDRHIESLKETIRKKDERIERQKETIEGLKKRLEALEKSPGVRAMKGLGIIKKPSS